MDTDNKSRPIWEEYEDYEEQFYQKGGSGGKKDRPDTSATSKKAHSQSIENSVEHRRQEAKEKLFSVLSKFTGTEPEEKRQEHLERYLSWLTATFQTNDDFLNPVDIETEFMRSSTKAGGQNVNKVNSAVRVSHLPTGISSRSDQSRDQLQNRHLALDQLHDKLKTHITDWKIFLNNQPLRPNLVEELLTELTVPEER